MLADINQCSSGLLAAAAAVSAALCVLQLVKQRRSLQLPVSQSYDGKPGPDDDQFAALQDGVPVERERFVTKTRILKLALSTLLLLVLVFKGWFMKHTSSNSAASITAAVYTYALLLSVISYFLTTSNTVSHWSCNVNLCVLLGLSVLVSVVTLLLDLSINSDSVASGSHVPHLALRLVEVLALFLSFLITLSIPRCPAYYFDRSLIYTSEILNRNSAATSTAVNEQMGNVSHVLSNSLLGNLLFTQADEVVRKTYDLKEQDSVLEIRDLPVLPSSMRSLKLFSSFKHIYGSTTPLSTDAHGKERGWKLLWKIIQANFSMLLLQTGLGVPTAVLYYGPAFFTNLFLKYLETDTKREQPYWGWIWLSLIVSAYVVQWTIMALANLISESILPNQIKIQMNTMIFSKTLVKREAAFRSGKTSEEGVESDDGKKESQALNLMTVDADSIGQVASHLRNTLCSPIEIITAVALLYRIIGVSTFFGMAVTLLLIPLNSLVGKIVGNVQGELAKARDERISLMNEVVKGIRMIKFMAWEKNFTKKVGEIREKELFYQKKSYFLKIVIFMFYGITPAIVSLVAFLHYAWWSGKPLTPSIAFTSISVLNELRFALGNVPDLFLGWIQAFVSLRRVQEYLASTEIPPPEPWNDNIFIDDATISWPTDSRSGIDTPPKTFCLKNLSLDFPSGALSLICGRIGSGKTLLLLALLGEAEVVDGVISCPRSPTDSISTEAQLLRDEDWLNGSVAYVPQQAWLQNASIKANIIFNLPLNQRRYEQVVSACSLLGDFKLLDDGDSTEVGEEGHNLSGGQKARISLARAIYSRASTLLIDDVLAAVDAETASTLFATLTGPLTRDRSVILVSHHIQLCQSGAEYIVALEDGNVSYQGSREDFLRLNMLDDLKHAEEAETVKEELLAETEVAETTEKAKVLIEDESQEKGVISLRTYAYYFGALGGSRFWILLSLMLLITTATPLLENLWIKYWSGSYVDGHSPSNPLFHIGIYALITVGGVLGHGLELIVTFSGSINASRKLHFRLLDRVMRAPSRWLDTTSTGRILSRFGKDMNQIDTSIAQHLSTSFLYFLRACVILVGLAVVGGWVFVLGAAIVLTNYYVIGQAFRRTQTQLQRLGSITSGPMYSLYSEIDAGAKVIRAFGASSVTEKNFMAAVDTTSLTGVWSATVDSWLQTRYNLLSTTFEAAVGISVLLSPSISASTAGFALAFAAGISDSVMNIIHRGTTVEKGLVAVERVNEYSHLVTEEPDNFIGRTPSPQWPPAGRIEAKNLSVRYAHDLPDVLNDISFSVEPGSHVGIVGTTGSGKSTLALSFFRFIEASRGSIQIDGENISELSLSDLRSRISIVPQEPTIFSGSLRSSLDPFDEYDDQQLFVALGKAHLFQSTGPQHSTDDASLNIFSNLDSTISENGSSLSQGQKQLLVFARAILRKSKVLVLDEATASIDYETDALINQTIKEAFSSSTLLVIAHRLRTVIHFDKILVLDKGRLIEYDTPSNLLRDAASRFYSLCAALGSEELATLQRLALEKEQADRA